MRTPKEIEQLVKEGKPLPRYANPVERYYYYAIDIGIARYQDKLFSKDDLRKYRKEHKQIYEHLCQQFELSKINNTLAIELSQVHLCGCEQCKRVARILEGRASCE